MALRRFHRLTVITNAVNIAADLAGSTIETILTAGSLRENSFSLCGPLAEEALRTLSADLLFLDVDGFDLDFGPSTASLVEAEVMRVMIGISGRVVVVCNSSKLDDAVSVGSVPPHSFIPS